MVDCFLGIDLGTSGIRAVLIDAEESEQLSARIALEGPERDGTRVAQHAASWWAALDRLLCRMGQGASFNALRAVAVDGTSGTVVPCDVSGRPLAPAMMYNDSRAQTQSEQIAALAPLVTGAQGPGSSLAKLLYLRERLPPDCFRFLLHQADWIVARLSGRLGITDENHALKLGYDAAQRIWPRWLDRLGIPQHLLPDVVPAGTAVGLLLPALARRWHMPPDVRVVAGTTDSTAGLIAAGAEQIGDAVTSLGSTLVLKVRAAEPVFAPGRGVYSHRLGDAWLVGGASNSGGAILQRYFDSETLARLSRQLDTTRRTCLEYYPLAAPGERFPVNDPALAPKLTPRPRDDRRFLHGLLESIARIERSGYRLLESLGAPYPSCVFTVGGGARNPAWTEIRRRLLGTELVPARHQEAAYGAALLARKGGTSQGH